MSNGPADAVIDATLDGDALAAAIEAHLDAHPLPVDEAEVARVADRLHARIRPPRRSWTRWAGLALLAAGVLLAVRAVQPTPVAQIPVAEPVALRLTVTDVPRVVRTADLPGSLEFTSARRRVEVAPDARLLTSEFGRTAVILVQEGEASVDGQPVPTAHWALLTRTPDGEPHDVVFPDGTAPPALDPSVWDTESADGQLRALRWQSLPPETLETLNQLLEAP